jgi:hypothetical protein
MSSAVEFPTCIKRLEDVPPSVSKRGQTAAMKTTVSNTP